MKISISKAYLMALVLASGLLITSCAKDDDAVQGCTDSNALNYDASATENCCCEYTVDPNAVLKTGAITADETWTNDQVVELGGRVWVESGATLTIEPGTVIKGQQGDGSDASALIVARGAQIMAEGNATEPIIFTTVLDDIQPGQISGSNLDEFDTGKWGGVIILGNAPISADQGDNVAQIEGIPADQVYGAYGGTNVSDDSGILTYASIRHGGILIGEGNEINGLTLGGVGNGTTIEYVEVVANVDDGIEFFGGSVDVHNAIVSFQGDDGIDIDQNYSGTVDNFMVIHGVDTDEALEIDGPEGTLTNGLFNLNFGTIISTDGSGSAADLKSKAQGTISQVYFEGYGEGSWLKLRESYDNNCTTEKADAYDNYISGGLAVTFCDFTGSGDICSVYTKSENDTGDVCPLPTGLDDAANAVFNMPGNSNNTGVASSTTEGADRSQFDNWSWSHANGIY